MLSIKHFSELTSSEFYDIAQAREKVFLLEQHIVCQDFDGVDKRAVHITLREDAGAGNAGAGNACAGNACAGNAGAGNEAGGGAVTGAGAVSGGAVSGGRILAYLRMFEDDGKVIVGRVLTTERGKGYGMKVMAAAEEAARERFGANSIMLHSQTQAIPFYLKCGYTVTSEEFLEEGVPHRMMEKVF